MIDLTLRDVSKAHPGGIWAVAGVSLRVAGGECVAVVGPSGCGKTTLLRLVAGLDTPTGGKVEFAGRDVAKIRPHERDVAMAFQSPALYPQLTVSENLGFGARVRRVESGEVARRVAAVANAFGLSGLLARRPDQLSGGQRQRVALGRAVVRRPAVLLLDEPLAHLDAPLRAAVREELTRARRQFGMTTLWVTHDPDEAAAAADRVVAMASGRLVEASP
jgi:ABC-type sugar transport system ATPase subunit